MPGWKTIAVILLMVVSGLGVTHAIRDVDSRIQERAATVHYHEAGFARLYPGYLHFRTTGEQLQMGYEIGADWDVSVARQEPGRPIVIEHYIVRGKQYLRILVPDQYPLRTQ